MKNLLFAVLFTVFSLCLPLTMAQQVVANETEVAVTTAEEDDGFTVRIDLGDAQEAEEDIEQAVLIVKKILGKEAANELKTELKDLNEDEREELRDLFSGKAFHIGDGDSGGLGFGEFMIAMTAIIFSLGMPIIILALFLYFGHRKRKQKMELISSYLAANQPVPEHVMADFGSDANANSPFRSGLTLTLVGIAIVIFFLGVGASEAAALGLIPVGIGLARLISWKYDQGNSNSNG
jgi:hypothetical protein